MPGLFVLSTYQVDQQEIDREMRGCDAHLETQDEPSTNSSSPPYTRRGMLRLYEASRGEGDDAVQTHVLSEEHMAAILDAKWTLARPSFASSSSQGLLAVADAQGHVTLHQLLGAEQASSLRHPWRLEQVADLEINPSKALCLSLDWSDRARHYPSSHLSTGATSGSDASLVVSQSDGSLAWLPSVEMAVTGSQPAGTHGMVKDRMEADKEDEESEDNHDGDEDNVRFAPWPAAPHGLQRWHAHDHEAWIAAFSPHSSGQILWSGGDDLALKGWDVRTPLRGGKRQPTFVNRKSFDGGVTTMQAHWAADREHTWAVGSYDSRLRIFDARQPLRPVAEKEMPGGIWRLKWHPENAELLLAGCMHGGFAVVRVGERSEPEIVSTFEEHDSLAYGCDWDRGAGEGGREEDEGEETMIYSCSFYDKKLCAWRG